MGSRVRNPPADGPHWQRLRLHVSENEKYFAAWGVDRERSRFLDL